MLVRRPGQEESPHVFPGVIAFITPSEPPTAFRTPNRPAVSVSVRKGTKVSASGPPPPNEHSCRPICPSLYAEGVWGDKNTVICRFRWQPETEKVVPSQTVTDRSARSAALTADRLVAVPALRFFLVP